MGADREVRAARGGTCPAYPTERPRNVFSGREEPKQGGSTAGFRVVEPAGRIAGQAVTAEPSSGRCRWPWLGSTNPQHLRLLRPRQRYRSRRARRSWPEDRVAALPPPTDAQQAAPSESQDETNQAESGTLEPEAENEKGLAHQPPLVARTTSPSSANPT